MLRFGNIKSKTKEFFRALAQKRIKVIIFMLVLRQLYKEMLNNI